MKENYINKIINGNYLDVIKGMPSEIVDAIITSPPYFVDMEYETIKKNEGNMLQNYDKYINELLLPIFKEGHRILKNGGHLWINIDDSHTSIKSELKKNIVLPTHAILISELSKLYDYKEMVLWKKIRGKRTSGGSIGMLGSYGRFGSPGSIPIVQEVEYVLWFKKAGKRNDIDDEKRKKSALTSEQFRKYGMQIWEIQPERNKEIKHPAPYPVELPERCIRLGSFIDDLILDPFNGSGTTCFAAKKNKRCYCGIDLNKEYCEMAEYRLNNCASVFEC